MSRYLGDITGNSTHKVVKAGVTKLIYFLKRNDVLDSKGAWVSVFFILVEPFLLWAYVFFFMGICFPFMCRFFYILETTKQKHKLAILVFCLSEILLYHL